jgi:acyl-coenzyme A thioesterase PaaI-like protein
MKAFQDYYPDELSYCYGCGRLNKEGHQLKSYWDGETSVARFVPKPYHTALPGFVSGGILASLIDCHGTGTAAAAAYRTENREPGSLPAHRFVTASLKVDYLRPTPLGPELVLHGMVRSVAGRKVVVDVELTAEGQTTVHGEVVAVEVPDHLHQKAKDAHAEQTARR